MTSAIAMIVAAVDVILMLLLTNIYTPASLLLLTNILLLKSTKSLRVC
jgi:hypothetical protein